jgi:hypothetical protein
LYPKSKNKGWYTAFSQLFHSFFKKSYSKNIDSTFFKNDKGVFGATHSFFKKSCSKNIDSIFFKNGKVFLVPLFSKKGLKNEIKSIYPFLENGYGS